jgi:DNA polymerase-1
MTKETKKQNSSTKKLVLLDAHAIIHRAYHALPDFSTSKGEPTGGLYGVSAMLIKIINELKPDYIVACYDLPKPTFRHEAYAEYKSGRAKADDELVSQIIRSRDIFEAFNIPIYEKEGFEADDMLGTISEQLKDDKNIEIIIASGDMDTLQLVEKDRVKVYTLRKGLNDTIIYDKDKVIDRYGFEPKMLVDYKGLRGDPSDNIIGIVGIGEKTATILIQKFGAIEDIYKKLKKNENLFIDAGIKPRIIGLLKDGEEEALFSKTLATIRLDAPIKFSLPKYKWSDLFDISKVEKLFIELEFRTLFARVKEMFGGVDNGQQVKNSEKDNKKEEKININDVKKISIALWLLRSDITNPTLDDIFQYTGVKNFQESKRKILEEIKKQKLEKVYEDIELPIIPIIKKAEDNGILIDLKYLEKLSNDWHKALSKIENKIWKYAGEEFNINSPKQLGEILFDKMNLSVKGLKKTAGGARSTRESELIKLKEEHKIIKEILSYRELQKLLSTYIDNVPGMVDDKMRLHTTLNQAGTTTGRFSSVNPNLQNIPASDGYGTDVRNAFVSGDKYKLVAFDYSQIEMRILAHLSEDEILINTFNDGGDVHTSVASRVFGVKNDEVTKEMRRTAKVINFGIIYGMGVNALKVTLGSSRQEAQEFYNNYFEKFPKIANYFENIKKEAREKGFTSTVFGRKRYFEGIKSKLPFVRASAERMAMNAPIQGTAADVIKKAMNSSYKAIKKSKLDTDARLLLQVHDELIYEVKIKSIDKVKKVVKDAMENTVKLAVPLVVNVKIGDRWGSME